MTLSVASAALLGAASDAHAQELGGVLIDRATAQPVTYAVVYVISDDRVYARTLSAGSTDYEFHAPDARVLLSPEFLADHCFSIARGSEAGAEIGLSFRPVDGRTSKLVDVSGTFWLDRGSLRLQRIEFRYEGSVNGQSFNGSIGLVEFTAGPHGAWVIGSWRVRLPLFEISRLSLAGAFDRRLTIGAYHEEGGRIERLTTDDTERQPLVRPAVHWP